METNEENGASMEIKSSYNKLLISGNIKSVAHFHALTNAIEIIKKEQREIQIHLLDSISITSSVIGYLCKLVSLEGISLSLFIRDDELHTLLDELNLIRVLNIQKI